MARVKIEAVIAEFIAMILFVVIGCGSACALAGTPGWQGTVSFAFGLAITSLAYATAPLSGGHINCAVTLGLVIVGACPLMQGIANVVGQILGSFAGTLILVLIFPREMDLTGGLGANAIADGFDWWNALIGEIVLTFLLVFVVCQTAVSLYSENNRAQACIAIGFAVFLAHCVLIPIDGCSINPTRTIGPNVIGKIRADMADNVISDSVMEDLWVFIVGPLVGAVLAAGTYRALDMGKKKSDRELA